MAAGVVEGVVARDRLVVLASLAGITAISWYWLFLLDAKMKMEGCMQEMSGMQMAAPYVHAWTTYDFALNFAMWAVMMVGMMTPSAAPMILIHARVARHSEAQGKPLAATAWFASGYLFAWTVFSLVATLLQAGLEQAALLAADASLVSTKAGGLVLIVAGLYQWTPAKDACLHHCRAPLHFIQSHGGFQKTASGSFGLGARHGLYCIGCCWALMALLFAGGVMNMLWVAGLSVFVLVEKIAPAGRVIAIAAGVFCVFAGVRLVLAG